MTDTLNASELFGQIAAALGARWEREFNARSTNDGWGILTLSDGVQLHLRIGGYGNEGRVNISGSYPSYTDAKGTQHIVTPRDVYVNNARLHSPDISVSMTRPVETIAKDIERRLLNTLNLRGIWKQCKARADATTDSYRSQRETVERTAKATGGEVRGEFKSISYGYEIGEAEHHGGYGDEPHTFTVTLRNLSPVMLAAVLDVVRVQGRKA